jgi:hypothetical protein
VEYVKSILFLERILIFERKNILSPPSALFMLVFWVATPCELVGRYQSFGKKHTVSIFRTLHPYNSSSNVACYKILHIFFFLKAGWV